MLNFCIYLIRYDALHVKYNITKISSKNLCISILPLSSGIFCKDENRRKLVKSHLPLLPKSRSIEHISNFSFARTALKLYFQIALNRKSLQKRVVFCQGLKTCCRQQFRSSVNIRKNWKHSNIKEEQDKN